VSWEIVGIRTNLSDDQRQITWNFTVILRETAGRGIQFEHIETSAQGGDHPDALMTGVEEVKDLHVGVYDVIPQLPDIDGLLGTDFLHRFVVNIDGGTRQLTLEKLP
jgi:hypothetical protein